MFTGKLANKRSGISKNGNDYYMISVFVDTASHRVQTDLFLTKDVFSKVEKLPYDSDITCVCGINDFGRLYVRDIK